MPCQFWALILGLKTMIYFSLTQPVGWVDSNGHSPYQGHSVRWLISGGSWSWGEHSRWHAHLAGSQCGLWLRVELELLTCGFSPSHRILTPWQLISKSCYSKSFHWQLPVSYGLEWHSFLTLICFSCFKELLRFKRASFSLNGRKVKGSVDISNLQQPKSHFYFFDQKCRDAPFTAIPTTAVSRRLRLVCTGTT